MKHLWKRLEDHLRSDHPQLLADLNAGASNDQIAELEQLIGRSLPADLVSCLQCHNGQQGRADWLFDGQAFMPCAQIARDWATLERLRRDGDLAGETARPAPGIRAEWWNPGWVPFAANGAGDHLCIDLAPTEQGTYGQVISYSAEFPGRRLKAPSFSAWFNAFVNARTGN